jgi:ABC-2 type transport system permease protein
MKAVLVLAAHSLRRSRALVVVMLLLLAGFEMLLVKAAGELQQSNMFSSFTSILPPFVREMFGDSLLIFMSYSGLVAFGYFHPVVIAALVGLVITLATEPAAEVETRFLDLVLARPVPRHAVVLRSALLVAVVPGAVVGSMIAGTLAGLRWLSPAGVDTPHTTLVAGLAANLWSVVLFAGGLALAAASMVRRRSTAAGISAAVLVAAFLLDYLGRIWKPAGRLSWLSPFHYYDAMGQVMGHPLPAAHLAVLVGGAMVGFAVALVVFSRRDV